MSLTQVRERRGLSLDGLAAELGTKSKGYLSRLETGAERASFRTALKIQLWSAGEVPAESLLSPDDAQLLREAIAAARTLPPAEAVPA